MKCSFCKNPLEHVFVDLVASPPSNAYLTAEQVNRAEVYYPLKVWACEACWLVQVDDVAGREVHFNENYAYFSSFSASLLAYSKAYVDSMVARLGLNGDSHVVEVASNDGYLLQYLKPHGVPCLGVEPTASTAAAAREKGVETLGAFFGEETATRLAAEGSSADLIVANNVMAHVPDIRDFAMGFKRLLKPQGTVTVEFQYLLNMVVKDQFDIVYHEHYSYLSLHAVKGIFEACGLTVYDVEEVSTQGGSLRVYGRHTDNDTLTVTDSVAAQLAKEVAAGLTDVATYTRFQAQADRVKDAFVEFLIAQKRAGKKVVAYGAAAKGTTMLNYAGIKPDLLAAVADASPHKQGKYLPGSHIPIVSPEALQAMKPDVVVILPWNLKDEIAEQLAYVRAWGGKLAVYLPKLEVF
ncbi:MAG: class I SAM-dependent methyltransferase [Alphaproteobacteria bacterium]|nr:MAG: class I SAM-dependent methyltransferase [Alphaproteobacteria bacterium]